jgi:hypothetical protein
VNVPTVWRPTAGKMEVSLPFSTDNRAWLRDQLGPGVPYAWDGGLRRWTLARNHLSNLVPALANRYGYVEVYIDFKTTVKCDKRCRDATGSECICQCLGENHRGGSLLTGWFEVGESTLITSDTMRRHMRVARGDVN